MESIYQSFLFEKHILVSEGDTPEEHPFEVIYALAGKFSIRITHGAQLARSEMLQFAGKELGINVPPAFYKGFPNSVRELSPDQLLFDQLVHYAVTYGFGDFSAPGHSQFEHDFERSAFAEDARILDFVILDEKEAEAKLAELMQDLLAGTRPLSDRHFSLLRDYIREHHMFPASIASKNTAIKLLLDLRDPAYAAFLQLPDVIKVFDELAYARYLKENRTNNLRYLRYRRPEPYRLRRAKLGNQDRRLITALIDRLIDAAGKDREKLFAACCEKKSLWCGLLHLIHYKPKTADGEQFAALIRGRKNPSVYSRFEAAMAEGRVLKAAELLREEKGASALLRQLNYLASRCSSPEELASLCRLADSKNTLLLFQLLLRYSTYRDEKGRPRTFSYLWHNMQRVHPETALETARRRSVLSPEKLAVLAETIRMQISETLKNRLGKVYIDPAMDRYALPIQESTSQGGLGVLPKGSRLPIGEAKKIRAFTYWEKVDDIDLSVIGLTPEGKQKAFSWQTMASLQSAAITFSGDQTSGYNGGSEFFDLDPAAFRKKWPELRYLVFCDNVFSGSSFSECLCKAGYMTRDVPDSGEIFEPKTVQSSFRINCESTFAYLFGIDMATNDFIWLNSARDSRAAVAGSTNLSFLIDLFHVTEIVNMKSFFTMMASEIVDDPSAAEVIVTDKTPETVPEGAKVVREYDTEYILSLLNR